MILVFDSSAVIALLRDEKGAARVEGLLDESGNVRLMHAVNVCEIYYGFRRESGDDEAQKALEQVSSMGIEVREDMDTSFWQRAGQYKADLAGISLADCFCAALAARTGGELVTTDRHEFGKVAEQGLCRVRFVR